jgi:phosphate starvation-inducible PhoH-like protein
VRIEAALGVTLARRRRSFPHRRPARRRSTARSALLDVLYERAARPLANGAAAAVKASAPARTRRCGGGRPDADEPLVLHTRHADLSGRTPNQVQYLRQMLAHDITFGIGPAGTGKTFLAVACAVDALERHGVQRIVLTRPAVEAGERLGFLPGDLAQKVDPYLRPLYDALYDLMGFDRVARPSRRA